ncbi:MAG TPA: hypothetical protein VFC67_26030 [Prolixibacteraceae bacterium]|nr:hypothetical protein [Prolixibacteraceae bacterium]
MTGITARIVLITMSITLLFLGTSSCGEQSAKKKIKQGSEILSNLLEGNNPEDESQVVNALLVSPKNPKPGEVFRVLSVGGKSIRKAKIVINGQAGSIESLKTRNGDGLPFWRIDEYKVVSAGKYKATLISNNKTVSEIEFWVTDKSPVQVSGSVWKNQRGWDSKTEALYSAWINALFYDSDERSSWKALHEVMQRKDQNILYNYLSLDEDDPAGKNKILMEPDCADNPFYMRAYFAWKLGLPFGYHLSDRGGIGFSPRTGQWTTNESSASKTQPVLAFNSFLRKVANGVHSGTARTALKDESSDYYPVPLTKEALRPGTVFADPYGHTLILVRWVPQSGDKPGVLLSVDAQPDGTVGIKRFWKGNFLFTTTDVIGDPGFKIFRPITLVNGKPQVLKNKELSAKSGMTPFSLQQQGMSGETFYHTMEQLINPEPMDPEAALLDLIQALHEQLTVRITSVSNGEAYMKSHPGEVISMPGGTSGVFQAGGQWEDFSTPNRDLRLLIAMDAVLDFPDKVLRSPDDFKMSKLSSAEHVKKNLDDFLSQKLTELSIAYIRTNGTEQKLTLAEILKRREAFEMAYNPNDGIEIRWGAPEKSEEYATCRRHVPAGQLEKMRSVRKWFQKRLHPPT